MQYLLATNLGLMNSILLYDKNVFFRDTLLLIIQSYSPQITKNDANIPEECLDAHVTFNRNILILGYHIFNGHNLDILREFRMRYPAVNIILYTDYNLDRIRKKRQFREEPTMQSRRKEGTGIELLALINFILTAREREEVVH